MAVLFDTRWRGDHGIGRFSREVFARIDARELPLNGVPYSPIDSIYLSIKLLGAKRGDVFFSPGYNSPFYFRGKFILTVHDLNHIDRSENSSFLKRIYYRFVLLRACRKAAGIVTVSEFSKSRISQWAKIPEEKIFVVGNGVSQCFLDAQQDAAQDELYFLCVGNRKGHKNEARVLRAFAAATLGTAIRLKFTGLPSAELHEIAEECDVHERVDFMGKLSENELARAYKNALALVFPSLYEGFGLPIIEAFATGTPVITGNRTSLPEIAGNAALLVDPYSIEAIATALQRIVEEPSLRAELSSRGRGKTVEFTWDAVAERVCQALNKI